MSETPVTPAAKEKAVYTHLCFQAKRYRKACWRNLMIEEQINEQRS